MKCTFTSFDKFIFRTPLFPLDSISSGSEINSEIFKEAIFLASPELSAGNSSQTPKKQEKFEQSLLKYYHRAATRCTPFGLFAGCSVGRLTDHTEIELQPIEAYTRHTRLDMQYLCALIQKIEQLPEVRAQLTWYLNDSLYKLGGKYRYIAYYYHNAARRHNLVSLEPDEALEQLLAAAAEGTTVGQLTHLFVSDDITREEAAAYVNEVIDSQILKSEIDPCVVGGDALKTLIAKLSRLHGITQLEPLQRLQTLLDSLDSRPIGSTRPVYDEIIGIVKELGVGYDAKFLFQTDLFKPVQRAGVSTRTAERIGQLIDLLAKIALPSENPNLANFQKAFQSRYEETEIPLAIALDRELGIGYPVSQNEQGDVSPLINDMVLPVQRSYITETRQTPTDRILFKKYIDCIRKNETVVELTDKDFEGLSFKHQFPDTIAAMCSLLDGDRILVRSIGGSCGANLLGRFCDLDNDILELVEEIAAYEEAQNPDVIYAEISHLPESRIGNIAARPAFRSHTLHYLSNTDHAETDIAVSDLMLSVRHGRLFLRSKHYDKEVIPRLTCAHNFSTSPIPVYRFLCELQYQGKTGGLQCGWTGLLSTLDYLPRIQYQNIILTRAQWKIRAEEIKDFDKLTDAELNEKFSALVRQKNIPAQVIVPDHDNELYLDLTKRACQRMAVELINKRKELTLEECLDNADRAVVRQNGHGYANEMIFVFHK